MKLLRAEMERSRSVWFGTTLICFEKLDFGRVMPENEFRDFERKKVSLTLSAPLRHCVRTRVRTRFRTGVRTRVSRFQY